jgi:hypothetical protein
MSDHIISIGNGRTKIQGRTICLGNDYIIIVKNLEGGHVGCIALFQPYLNKKNKIDVSMSIISSYGHQDIELLKPYKKISRDLNITTSVIAGIHVNKATKEELQVILENNKKLVEQILIFLASEQKKI